MITIQTGRYRIFRVAAFILLATLVIGTGAAAVVPEADFSFSPQSPYVGEPVTFDASGSTPAANITQYSWTFGDGSTAGVKIPSHTFTQTGEFLVTLVVTTTDSQNAQIGKRITVSQRVAPVVLAISPATGYQGDTKQVTITGQNFDELTSARLERNGAVISLTGVTASSTTITGNLLIPDGAAPGVWTVVVETASGTSGSSAATFTVAARDAAPAVTGVTPASIDQGTSAVAITVQGANFRDNARVYLTKTGQTAIQILNEVVNTETGVITGTVDIPFATVAGGWNVVVENSDGSISDDVITLTVNEVGEMVISSMTPGVGYRGDTISYSIMGEFLRNGVPVLRLGGNQITMNVANRADGQLSGTFTISSSAYEGWYDLLITNSGTGAVVIDESAFHVLPEPEPEPPEAGFTFFPSDPEVGEEVSFTDTSTNDPDDWEWDFGDNTGEDIQNPDHTYTSAGTYTVELTVSNADGEESVIHAITVIEAGATPTPTPGDEEVPEASFTTDRTRGMPPLVVTFTDTSVGEIDEWLWDFGDGGESTQQNPTHTYSYDGEWLASLTVKNSAGSDTATTWITIGVEGLEAYFTASPTRGTAPLTVSFTEDSSGSPESYKWDFDNGQTFPLQNAPSITYTSPGTYDVTLTVTAGEDTDTKTVRITVASPTVVLTATPAATAKALSAGVAAGGETNDRDFVTAEYRKLTGLYNEYLRYLFGVFGWEPPAQILIAPAEN